MSDDIDLSPEYIDNVCRAAPFADNDAGIPQMVALIRALSARLAEVGARPYHYIGKDGKTVLARDLEDRAEAAKAQLALAVEALQRIADASDVYGIEANADDQGADTLAYAHRVTGNLARATLAAIKAKAAEVGQ
jgi:hypothetical protein